MDRKTVVYVVKTSVAFSDDADWLKKVREIRKRLKDTIGSHPDMKILKIDSKEE